MGKIRVYELARELNIKNKELLEKLSKMAIKVSSHMSSLDDEAVDRVKSNLLGNKTDVVEVTRIKPTVIRRRKKIVPVEAVPEKEVPLEKVCPPEKITTDEQPSEKTIEEKAPIAEPELKKAEKPETVKMKDAEKGIAEKKAVLAKDEKKSKQPPVVKKSEAVTSPKGKKPKKVKKKLKKETPAKIIKMPTPHEEKLPETEQPQMKKLETKVEKPPEIEKEGPISGKVQKDLSPKEKKKGKKDKITEEPVTDKKFFKKKISFRKKEVIEGADLYPKQHRGRKTRKAVAKTKAAIQAQKPQITIPKAIKRRIKIDDAIVLADLAKRMGIKANEIIKSL
ncbi:MAG: translation initiation factor IF-2 N-terminal domain-containing protein, partial [Deltaproteobacteria bacterium]|nr:translation initiation factor IF-2 N-terminal domain-containing protein [Deltaproteobacteria bacterium]